MEAGSGRGVWWPAMGGLPPTSERQVAEMGGAGAVGPSSAETQSHLAEVVDAAVGGQRCERGQRSARVGTTSVDRGGPGKAKAHTSKATTTGAIATRGTLIRRQI